MTTCLHSIDHSWYSQIVHIFRSDGRIIRAKVGALSFQEGGIYMRLRFRDGSSFQKLVSPLMIASVHIFWLNVDVVSDVDLEDGDATENNVPFEVPKEVPRILIPLTIDQKLRNQLSPVQISGIDSVMTDISHILNILD